MKNCKKYFPIFALAVLMGCGAKNDIPDFSGYWRDSTGMALFQVQADGDAWVLSSSLGSLKGQKVGNSIRGTTDLQDSFAMEVKGNTAVYHVLGVTIDYTKISKAEFDSLTSLQGE